MSKEKKSSKPAEIALAVALPDGLPPSVEEEVNQAIGNNKDISEPESQAMHIFAYIIARLAMNEVASHIGRCLEEMLSNPEARADIMRRFDKGNVGIKIVLLTHSELLEMSKEQSAEAPS